MEFSSRSLSINDVHKLIRSSKIDSIFALPHFMELKARDCEKICFYVEIRDGRTKVDTITPVVVSNSFLGLKMAFCPTPPQVIDSSNPVNNWNKVLNALVHYLKENYNCIAVLMNQRPHDFRFAEGNLNGCKVSYNFDIVIDLSNMLQDIYYNIDKRHRYTLRRCSNLPDKKLLSDDWLQKTDFAIREGMNKESTREFRTLWVKTLNRMYKGFSLLRKFSYRDPLTSGNLSEVVDSLYPYGLVNMLTMYDESETPGASVILFSSNNFTKTPMAYWSAGASSKEGQRRGLPTLLQWYTMKWLKEHGYTRYYMGGYDVKNPNDGPSLFKRGFGGQIVKGLVVTWIPQTLMIMRDIASHAANLLTVFKAS